MSYQFVVNPNQRQYRVEGQPQNVTVEDPLVLAPLATTSLLPKPDSQPDERHDENGPPRVQKTSGNEGDPNPPIYQGAQNDQTGGNHPVSATGITKCNEIAADALDEAIEESKAVKDLVCL